MERETAENMHTWWSLHTSVFQLIINYGQYCLNWPCFILDLNSNTKYQIRIEFNNKQ